MVVIRNLAILFLCFFLVMNANAAVTISNVVVSDGNKATVDNNLQPGDGAYSDRDYTFGEIPDKYLGLPFIKMPMTSSKVPIKPGLEISFDIDKEAYVYLFWATSEAPLEWLTDDYINTGDLIFMGQDMQAWPGLHERQVWRSEEPFKPGKVTTYEVTQDAAIYIVLVEEVVSKMAVPPDGRLAATWAMLKMR